MPADNGHHREAAAVLAEWHEVERTIRDLRPEIAKERALVVELTDLHAKARRLRIEYAEIIRGPALPARDG
jgi:ParB-like chromosome segregation protein Spo0J